MKNVELLRSMLNSKSLEFIMEAHNGLSAKIVKETGFKGIWASGLSLSASMGVRDSNEASWTQLVDILEQMETASNLPILFDGDTGFGNFNNFRLLCKTLVKRNIAGVCIEDKLFPKTNSFVNGEFQSQEDPARFGLKIKAGRDTVGTDLVIVARVESFITGKGLEDALHRARIYAESGADAILIHSKRKDASEIFDFMSAWSVSEYSDIPIIIVPTKYYQVPTEQYRKNNIAMVIWANHNIRSCITAMENTSKSIFEDQSLSRVENKIATVNHIFELQNQGELSSAEVEYDIKPKECNAIILSATRGSQAMGYLTEKYSKCAISVNEHTLIDLVMKSLKKINCTDFVAVLGYEASATKDRISTTARFLCNCDWSITADLYSLFLARGEIKKDTVICYGDTLFSNRILSKLNSDEDCDLTIVADPSLHLSGSNICVSKPSYIFGYDSTGILSDEGISACFCGLLKINSERMAWYFRKNLSEIFGEIQSTDLNKFQNIITFIEKIPKEFKSSVIYATNEWADINTPENLIELQKIVGGKND